MSEQEGLELLIFFLPIFSLVTENAVSSYKTGILLESKNHLKTNFAANNLETKFMTMRLSRFPI